MASATDAASARLRGMASGNLDAKSIQVRINLCPFLDLGRGPTISKATLVQGVSMTGRGMRGA